MATDVESPWRVSTELTAKVNRFELAASCIAAVVVATAAIVTAREFTSIQVASDCLRNWVASVAVAPDCELAVAQWSALSEGNASKVMTAMAILPSAAGLLFGVPVVAREIEAGTAPLAWAVAGSRRRWLTRQVVPLIVMLTAILALDAMAATWLADARSGDNVWSSTFADVELFGAPVVARGLACFAVGVLVGAVVGRMLPALLVGLAISAGLTLLVTAAQPTVVRSTYQMVDVGAPGASIAFIRANPDVDVLFVTEANRIVTLNEASSEAPPETPDAVAWLADHARLVPLGVASSATFRWQVVETVLLLVAAAGSMIVARYVVQRRTPR